MSPFRGEYNCELSNVEKLEPDFAMTSSKAVGGTMILWRKSLDKYITVHEVQTSSFLPIIFSPPGSPVTAHVALYLPTSGRESDFLEAITMLCNTLEDISEKYDNCLIFLRGDANVNTNNKERMAIFSSFLEQHCLSQVKISHKTYHHFLGGGAFDSNIDIILEPKDSPCESITTIYCKHDYPQIDSHHDVILSSFSIPVGDLPSPQDNLITAPRLSIHRHKILWSDEGIVKYKELVAERLSEIRMRWLDPSSKTSLSVLLATTNDILSRSALASNKSVDLSKPVLIKSEKKPASIKHSEALLKRVHKSAAKNETIK